MGASAVSTTSSSFSKPISWLSAILLTSLIAGLIQTRPCVAQVGGPVGFTAQSMYPSQEYFTGLDVYRSGDVERAVDWFEQSLRRTRRDINGRWIDAIPVHAMLAECMWQLGDVAKAREQIDQAFQIVARYRGWLQRPVWTGVLQPAASVPPQGLWPEAQAIKRLPISSRMQYQSGKLLTANDLLRGGPIQESLHVKTLQLVEIMRGLQIASYRRRIIMGPLSNQDPLAAQVLESTKYPSDLNIPIAKTLIGAMRAAERFAVMDDKDSVQNTTRTAIVDGGVHPLTPVSLLCQATILSESNPKAVGPVALNVANTAAALGHFEWIGEALQLAAGCATPEEATIVRQAAMTAAGSRQIARNRLTQAHCLVAGADAAITGNEFDAAKTLLAQAGTVLSRRDVSLPRTTAYWNYVRSRLSSVAGDTITSGGELDSYLAAMNQFALDRRNRRERNRLVISMPRVYQFELIRQSVGSRLGGQTSERMLAAYCQPATDGLWRRDPVDALSSQYLDRTLAYAARLDLAASRTDGEDVLARTDDLLNYRFRSQLPMGGRLAQIRSLVRSSDEVLGPQIAALRNKAPKPIQDLRKAAIAPPPADKKALAGLAAKLESQISRAALDRVRYPQTMLPTFDGRVDSTRIPKRKAMLTFVSSGNKVYATLTSDGKVTAWSVKSPSRVASEVGRLLKSIGVGKVQKRRLPPDETWRTEAVKLRRHLMPDDAMISPDLYDEIVIVPDSVLWYVPFELFPVSEEKSKLWGDSIRIRYAATPGLAIHPTGPPAKSRKIGIAGGKFFSRDLDTNTSTLKSIADVAEEPVALPADVPGPSNFLAESVGHLVIASATNPNLKSLLASKVTTYDNDLNGGDLGSWMQFPAQVPASVSIPGYRSMLHADTMGTGQDLFLTICSLQASGTRDVLISRWAVGGESTATALREYVQELPFSGVASSWRRARQMLQKTDLDPAAEITLMKADQDRPGLKGNEPYFWSGYLIASPFGEKDLQKARRSAK